MLLHGIACSVVEWERVVDAVATEHRVFAVDLLGHGFTDKPAGGPFDMVGIARWVLDS